MFLERVDPNSCFDSHNSEKYMIIAEHRFGGNIMAKVEEFNLLEFQKKFNTEKACEKYLSEQR